MGGLAKTKMPTVQIWTNLFTINTGYKVSFCVFDKLLWEALRLILAHNESKRKYDVPSANFAHIATAISIKSNYFITMDERHFLREEFKEAFKHELPIVDPNEAVAKLKIWSTRQASPRLKIGKLISSFLT